MKNCALGLACGEACINKLKTCRTHSSGPAVSLSNRLQQVLIDLGTQSGYSTEKQAITKTATDKNGHEITVTVTPSYFDAGDGAVFHKLDFTVDKAYDSGRYISNLKPEDRNDRALARERISTTLKARELLNEVLATMKDGTLLSNNPEWEDMKGKARADLYVRAGFSVPYLDDNDEPVQVAVKKQGKIVPLDLKNLGDKGLKALRLTSSDPNLAWEDDDRMP